MSDKKKINKISLILHTIPILVLVYFDETSAPSWFEDYINPEEALSIQENVILLVCCIPLFFLLGLWFKSLFNTSEYDIFNTGRPGWLG